jgi:uncharacterized protein YfaS (alpha-2-macroglobulin family)
MRPRLVVSGLGILLVSCPASRQAVQVPDDGDSGDVGDDGEIAKDEGGLEFKLSEGRPAAEVVDRARVAKAESLGQREVTALLARLPALQTDKEDIKAFALRAASQPPPKTGTTVLASFPGPARGGPPIIKQGAVEVLRHSPDGEVPIAADFSITFSQPMVAVTSRGELAAAEVPVTMSPQPPGQWVWVGTKTLVFRPTGRFPMATEYSVTVKPGAVSATGAGLAPGTAAIQFATPPVRMIQATPRDTTTVRRPGIFLLFDQRVDPAAVLPSLRMVPQGGEAVEIEVVAQAEAVKDEALRGLIDGAEPGRWMVVRPKQQLPGNTSVNVQLAVGLPSAEGPRKAKSSDGFSFQTFGPMALTKAECGWNNECPPNAPFRFEFTNPIDDRKFKKEWVKVEPEIPGMTVAAYGGEIHIQGRTKARTSYRVTVSGALRDVYKQTLGKEVSEKFTVGPAPEMLSAQADALTVLDPAAGGKFSVFTTGHKSLKVRVHAVTPADWEAYLGFMRARNESTLTSPTPPGKAVFSDSIKIAGDVDELTETRVDLGSAIKDGVGHAILIVEPGRPPKNQYDRQQVITWVQATRIGLDAFVDEEQMVAFATGLADGRPLAGAQLKLVPSGAQAVSGADGLATMVLPAKGNRVLQATVGGDVAFLPENQGWWYGDPSEMGWRPNKRPERLLWYVFDDRQLYRPGETVRVKGWMRKLVAGEARGLALPTEAVKEIRYTLNDAQGNKLLTGTRAVSALGGFDLTLALPNTPNLGYASLMLEVVQGTMRGQSHGHGLQIQEFRRPEYEVTARASEGPHFVGGHAELTVAAKYFSGGPLAGADVRWSVVATPGTFTPPGRDGFTFGRWRPWWGEIYRWGGGGIQESAYREPEVFVSKTDGTGEHHLRADFIKVTPSEPTSVRAEATVTDVNRQAWTAGTDVLVHPASVYVGMKSERLFVQKGEALDVDAIAVDLDGKSVVGRDILIRAVRQSWEQDAGEYKIVEKDAQDCRKASTEAAVRCSFVPKEGGEYKVTASSSDAQGRRSESTLTLWVAGGDQPPSRDLEQEQVTLIPDKKEYAGGETAKLLVMAPFGPSEGVVTVRREGLVQTRRISVAGTSTTVEVAIDDAYAPGVTVQVDLVGAAARTRDDGKPDPSLPKRPAYASGNLALAVPARSKSLNLYLKPGATKLEPGGSTTLEVLVHDAKDQPVAGSEVAVVVVDEAVLALANYDLADPLAAFYPQRDAGVGDYHSRGSVVLTKPEEAVEAGGMSDGGPGGGGGLGSVGLAGAPSAEMAAPPAPPAEAPMDEGGNRQKNLNRGKPEPAGPAIAVRKNFDALALFAAALPTDAQGRARVDIKVPDNLTRYRVMAVAVAGADRFGKAESAITARLPLMVRPSPPRFLNYGDTFELPIVVQNQTDGPLTVDLAARTANLDLVQGAGRRVLVPANDRVEVRLPAAAVKPGTARFQIAAASGKWADAATGELPVWTPATTEAFATYGQIDGAPAVQPIKPPSDAVPLFGGLEITTSSTAVAELTDAVLYLVRYPFECHEQLASRLLTIAALRDVLQAFDVPGMPAPAELAAFVTTDIERLARLQNPDGGWGFWRQGERAWPYLTVHVAHALERARSKGYAVPPATLDRAQDYMKGIEAKFDSWYPVTARRPIVAYALYVRQRLGIRDVARAKSLLAEVAIGEHSLETLGWLLPVLGDSPESKTIVRHLGNQLRETAGAAHFTTGYSDGGHLLLHSERRVDGVLLDALIGAEPQSDIIPKLVRGLLAHRTAGRWSNTQENAFILLALDRYFATYEKATPDFVARAWLGDKSAGEHAFKGRTTEQHRVDVPMQALIKEGAKNLVLAKTGPGRLYYRLGLRYAPKDLNVPAADYGFVVERKYAAIDDKEDVKRDGDGTWRIKAGARVQVTLTMVAQDRRYHVALVDPLPAGLEAVNPALATTGSLDPSRSQNQSGSSPYGYGWWWWRPWYEHENLRDERVEAFTPLLWDGVYSYSYVARATTPGQFVVPPAKAEEMYAPETFGRSAGDRVIVE